MRFSFLKYKSKTTKQERTRGEKEAIVMPVAATCLMKLPQKYYQGLQVQSMRPAGQEKQHEKNERKILPQKPWETLLQLQ